MKKKRKRIILIVCVAVLIVLCFPIRFSYEDGGSYGYMAVLYRVTFYHGMLGEEMDENGNVWFVCGSERVKAAPGEWWVFGGTEVQILGFTVYDNTGLKKVSDAKKAQSEQTHAPTAEATETPTGNPFFTCTGTEYGPYPIIPYQQREAEAKAFLTEHRELLERAAAELLNGSDIKIFSGEARMRNDEGRYEPVDAATLSESLQALMRLSEEYDVDCYVGDPDPVFSEDAAQYFEVYMPMAIDETMYTDPGTLYYVALIYTTNTEEQITDSYRHDVKSLEGNWFIETYFYAY